MIKGAILFVLYEWQCEIHAPSSTTVYPGFQFEVALEFLNGLKGRDRGLRFLKGRCVARDLNG